MNPNIAKKAKSLNTYLLSLEVVKEYKLYEELVHNNPELIALEKEIKALQKEIVNQKAKEDPRASDTIKEYQKAMDTFTLHPLVTNYMYLKEEVDNLLQEVNSKLNTQLSMKGLTK